ncbi:hypothetical protein T31B1_13044 [Salinisphaera sp. T31B1]
MQTGRLLAVSTLLALGAASTASAQQGALQALQPDPVATPAPAADNGHAAADRLAASLDAYNARAVPGAIADGHAAPTAIGDAPAPAAGRLAAAVDAYNQRDVAGAIAARDTHPVASTSGPHREALDLGREITRYNATGGHSNILDGQASNLR